MKILRLLSCISCILIWDSLVMVSLQTSCLDLYSQHLLYYFNGLFPSRALFTKLPRGQVPAVLVLNWRVSSKVTPAKLKIPEKPKVPNLKVGKRRARKAGKRRAKRSPEHPLFHLSSSNPQQPWLTLTIFATMPQTFCTSEVSSLSLNQPGIQSPRPSKWGF